jgi:hypothetical protein
MRQGGSAFFRDSTPPFEILSACCSLVTESQTLFNGKYSVPSWAPAPHSTPLSLVSCFISVHSSSFVFFRYFSLCSTHPTPYTLGEMISNMHVPSSLTEALSLGLNPRTDWMIKVYAFDFLRQCLLERGPKGIQEVAQILRRF